MDVSSLGAQLTQTLVISLVEFEKYGALKHQVSKV